MIGLPRPVVAVVASRADKARDVITPRAVLMVPALLSLVLLFVLPLLALLRLAFNRFVAGGGMAAAWTVENFTRFFTDPFYLRLAWTTVRLSVLVTLMCLVLGYPVALFLARSRSRWRLVLTVLAVSPLLTSAVVRTYGWMVILGNDGLVNATLRSFGLVNQPLRLVNSFGGVMVGLVEVLLPFMILSVMSGLNRVQDTLEEAAQSLGAGPFRTFWRVTLPLSLPGIATGCLLVFVQTISSFVTPSLLGGNTVLVMATEIYDQAVVNLNWPFAATLSFILLAAFTGVILIYNRAMRTTQSW